MFFLQTEIVTAELCELNRNMMLSVDVVPVPTDEAVREVENRLLGVETNITNWQRKQNQNNNFSAVIPYDLEQQRNIGVRVSQNDVRHFLLCRERLARTRHAEDKGIAVQKMAAVSDNHVL